MVAIGCGRRLPAFFFRCDFFLVELEDFFPIFLDPAAFFDLRNFPCDEAPECRFGFRLGFNFNVSAATVNPSTSSRLIDVGVPCFFSDAESNTEKDPSLLQRA